MGRRPTDWGWVAMARGGCRFRAVGLVGVVLVASALLWVVLDFVGSHPSFLPVFFRLIFG